MRAGDRGRRQTARPVSPAPDDVRPRARDAAPGGGRGAGVAGRRRARPPAGARRGGARAAALLLALDADTTEFSRRFRHDPLLGAVDPRPARAAAAAAADGRACAAAGDLRPADRGDARARDRAGDPAGVRRARSDARGDRRALSGASCASSGSRPHRASTLVRVCRSLDLEGLRGAADRGGRAHGCCASAGSGRGRSA